MLPLPVEPLATVEDDTSPPATAGADPAQYFPLLDPLRIVLASIVALGHTGVWGSRPLGSVAVQLFLALSGWLIGGILLRSRPPQLARFWFNRATRIWIPYAAALGLVVAFALASDALTPKWLEFVLYKLTFTYNLFGQQQEHLFRASLPLGGAVVHFWSISAEEQFYLLSPLLLVLAPPRVGRSPILWALLAALTVALDAYGAITVGVLAAILHQRWGRWFQSRGASAALALLGAASGISMIALAERWYYAAPTFSIAVVLLLARPGRRSRVGALLGGISYPLYLNHWLGIYLASRLAQRLPGLAGPGAAILALLLALLLASVMYLLIDRPVMAHRAAWFEPRRGWILAAVGFLLVGLGVAIGIVLRIR